MQDNSVILLVEDNPYDEALTLEAFKVNRLNNKVIVARDGEEALDFLMGTGPHENRSVEDFPQVVLLDLKLPKVDGLDVLRAIRSHKKTELLPVVILTSSKEEEDMIKGYKLGANSYVRKPVDFLQFIDVIKQLGLYWLAINEQPARRDCR